MYGLVVCQGRGRRYKVQGQKDADEGIRWFSRSNHHRGSNSHRRNGRLVQPRLVVVFVLVTVIALPWSNAEIMKSESGQVMHACWKLYENCNYCTRKINCKVYWKDYIYSLALTFIRILYARILEIIKFVSFWKSYSKIEWWVILQHSGTKFRSFLVC